MASKTVVLVTVCWLGAVVVTPLACGNGGGTPDGGDALGNDAASECGSFGCVDAQMVNWMDTDAALGARARALFDTTCGGGPESGCHSESAGGTDLLVSDKSSFGIINIPSSEEPDVLRVEPFHPETSYLYWKVSGDPRILDGSFIMPAVTPGQGGTVDPQIVALVGPWIEAGAP